MTTLSEIGRGLKDMHTRNLIHLGMGSSLEPRLLLPWTHREIIFLDVKPDFFVDWHTDKQEQFRFEEGWFGCGVEARTRRSLYSEDGKHHVTQPRRTTRKGCGQLFRDIFIGTFCGVSFENDTADLLTEMPVLPCHYGRGVAHLRLCYVRD
jgi:hypothetical protein